MSLIQNLAGSKTALNIIRGLTLLIFTLLAGCSTKGPELSGVNNPTQNEAFNESLESFGQFEEPGADNFLSPQ